MAFTRKLKTASKWFALNELFRNSDTLQGAINGDGGLQGILAEMKNTLVSLYADALGTSPDDAPVVDIIFPIAKRVYFGELVYDVFDPVTKTVKKGENKGQKYKAYIGRYGPMFAEQAGRMRDRAWTIVEIQRQNDDLDNLDVSPNPGGQVAGFLGAGVAARAATAAAPNKTTSSAGTVTAGKNPAKKVVAAHPPKA